MRDERYPESERLVWAVVATGIDRRGRRARQAATGEIASRPVFPLQAPETMPSARLTGLTDLTQAPAWAQRFQSRSVDEVRAFIEQADGPHSRSVRPNRPFMYATYRVHGRLTAMAVANTSQPMTIRGRVRSPVIHLEVPAGTVYRVGRSRIEAGGHDTAVMVPPEWDFSRSSPAGGISALMVDAAALAAEMQSRCPEDGTPWALAMGTIDLFPAARARRHAALTDLVRATQPHGDGRALAHAEARLVEAVAAALLRGRLARRAGHVALERVKSVEAWIDAHLGEPITLGRLCTVAGVGERSLQKAFEASRGMSPMRFVAERRLAVAYQRLSTPVHRTSVKAVALDLGFHHLGRFAQAYSELIGETPSQTAMAPRSGQAHV